MTFLDSMYGTPYLASLFISSFPNFLNPKVSIQSVHGAFLPNHLHLRMLGGSCCPKSPTFCGHRTELLGCSHPLWPPALSIPGPAQPAVEQGRLGWITEWLGHQVGGYCFGCIALGCLFFKRWFMFDRKNIQECNGQSRWSASSSRKTMQVNPTVQGGEKRTGDPGMVSIPGTCTSSSPPCQGQGASCLLWGISEVSTP